MTPPGAPTTHVLAGTGPHDPRRLLAFVGAHAVAGVELWDGHGYARTLDLPQGPGIARLHADGPAYALTLWLSDDADRPAALAAVRRLVAIDADVTAAEQAMRADPVLGACVASRPGLRPPGSVDHPETLLRAVLGQQVSLAGARALGARIVAAHGRPLPASWRSVVPGLTSLWPRAATIAALPATDAAFAMPHSRAATVIAAAAAVVSAGGELPPSADLLELRGVGPWTARYVDLRCRADPDVFLSGDLAARRALARLGGPSQPRAVADFAGRWSPYRSLALMHLWGHYLDL